MGIEVATNVPLQQKAMTIRTAMVTDAAGDHVSKSSQRTGGGFGAPFCSLLSDSIKLLVVLPSGFEHEVLDRFPVA